MFQTFFEIKSFYQSFIYHQFNDLLIQEVSSTASSERPPLNVSFETLNHNRVYLLSLIPDYINVKLIDGYKGIKVQNKEISSYALLSEYKSFDDYAENQLGNKKISKIRKSRNKLESSFNIAYKMYYGAIESAHYDYLFETMKSFIIERFQQKNEQHIELKNIEEHKRKAFDLILQKKASIFVIYNGEIPIDICLNYHFEKTMISYFGSFDTNYSKYSLGYIDILKLVEWCFENDYKLFSLGLGSMEYKSEFCNNYNPCYGYIIYYKKNFLSKFMANILALAYKTKARLKKE